jgi:hypothetical protein
MSVGADNGATHGNAARRNGTNRLDPPWRVRK